MGRKPALLLIPLEAAVLPRFQIAKLASHV